MSPQSEADIQAEIFSWLKAHGYCAWRCNLGGVRRSGKGWSKNPMAGFPDLGAVHWRLGGRLIAIEVKRTGGVISAAQSDWHRRLAAAGALVIVATTLEQVRAAIQAAVVGLPVEPRGPESAAESPEGCDEF